MELKFGEYDEFEGAELLCPNCGFNYLHHDQVDIFERGEDSSNGLHIRVTEGQAVVDTSLNGNPSDRRHGLSIGFWCEGCHAKLALTFSQHKGVTLVNFINVGKIEA